MVEVDILWNKIQTLEFDIFFLDGWSRYFEYACIACASVYFCVFCSLIPVLHIEKLCASTSVDRISCWNIGLMICSL